MHLESQRICEPPSLLRALIPQVPTLYTALVNSVKVLPARSVVFRAAGGAKYVLPEKLLQAYRFGPPLELRQTADALPYAWLYVALDQKTAIWESRFARTDATRPGGFYLEPAAVQNGVIGSISFKRDLRLWDLTGEVCAKLGIHDTISSGDYEACHWIGDRLRQAMLSCAPEAIPDGFRYPSRRMRGHQAIALRSELLHEFRATATVSIEPFLKCDTYAELVTDPLCLAPPNQTQPFPTITCGQVEATFGRARQPTSL